MLSDLTWPEVRDRAEAGATLVVPLGSTEQHGPHLPVSTDADLALALALELDNRRPDIVVGPLISYGSSGEHAGFPGTLSIGQEALELLLLELGRSAAMTFAHLLLVSTHGGNAEPVRRAVDRLRTESRDLLAWSPRLRGDAHAGHTETSLLLFLRSSRVRMDLAAAGDTRPIGELMLILRERSVQAVSPNGVLGDPTGASSDLGAAMFRKLADDLAAAVRKWRDHPAADAGAPMVQTAARSSRP